jgi:hypothetical protein
MKIKSLFVAVLLMGGVLVAPANAAEKPTVESFTFSPQEIDLSAASTAVAFELVISHPSGVENTSTLITLKNSRNDTLIGYLTRTDSNLASSKVTFKGSVTIPRNVNAGVYKFSAATVKNNLSAGYQYETGSIDGLNVRNLIGAESGLLIRENGDLNLDYKTFFGPTYDTTLGVTYNNPVKYNASTSLIWKVGEVYDPSKYFELRVPSLALSISSTTPSVCSSDGKQLSFIKEGTCAFAVSTPKTKDYASKVYNQTVTITSARTKPTLSVDKIVGQASKEIGKFIDLGRVYSVAEGWILPVSSTPTVCFATGFFAKLISSGTCKLTYQTAATSEYLASDLYTQSFEILSDGKPVVAPTPAVTPAPTPTVKPVVKKTITCTKGKKSVKRTGTAPKCPKGYKLKK